MIQSPTHRTRVSRHNFGRAAHERLHRDDGHVARHPLWERRVEPVEERCWQRAKLLVLENVLRIVEASLTLIPTAVGGSPDTVTVQGARHAAIEEQLEAPIEVPASPGGTGRAPRRTAQPRSAPHSVCRGADITPWPPVHTQVEVAP